MKKSMEGKSGERRQQKFAKAAARQAALRKPSKRYKKKDNSAAKDPGPPADHRWHGQNRDRLVNKQLTNEMMQRQPEILTRLLEAEKAERDRQQDE
jgi:hypothetical protein